MVNLPAVCRSCGFTFGSGIVVENCANSSFYGNTSRCPKCGSVAEILDATTDESGTLSFSQSAYNVLTSPAVSPDTLDRLKFLVAQQQKEDLAKLQEFIREIEVELPELSTLKDLLVPKNAGEFYGMLGFILTLIVFIQTMRASKKQPVPTVVNNYYGYGDPEEAAYLAAHQAGGLKRKALCPCGSGKKFKNCHGKST